MLDRRCHPGMTARQLISDWSHNHKPLQLHIWCLVTQLQASSTSHSHDHSTLQGCVVVHRSMVKSLAAYDTLLLDIGLLVLLGLIMGAAQVSWWKSWRHHWRWWKGLFKCVIKWNSRTDRLEQADEEHMFKPESAQWHAEEDSKSGGFQRLVILCDCLPCFYMSALFLWKQQPYERHPLQSGWAVSGLLRTSFLTFHTDTGNMLYMPDWNASWDCLRCAG